MKAKAWVAGVILTQALEEARDAVDMLRRMQGQAKQVPEVVAGARWAAIKVEQVIDALKEAERAGVEVDQPLPEMRAQFEAILAAVMEIEFAPGWEEVEGVVVTPGGSGRVQ